VIVGKVVTETGNVNFKYRVFMLQWDNINSAKIMFITFSHCKNT